jgi:hypothetical protein
LAKKISGQIVYVKILNKNFIKKQRGLSYLAIILDF